MPPWCSCTRTASRACRSKRRPSSGISTRPRSPAATSTTTRSTRRRSRCARCSRRSSRQPRLASTPPTLGEIQRYTKLFWINTGPYNNLTARKFVLTCTPEAAARRQRGGGQGWGACFRSAPARRSMQLLARLGPMFFDPAVDPMVTAKTPPAGQGHPDRERQQSLRRRLDEGSRGLQGALSAQLAAGEARTAAGRGGLSRRRPLRRRRSRAIVQHLEAALPFADRADGRGARARWSRSTRAGETADRARLRHRLGARTRPRRSTPSTGSSRSTSTPAASRARGRRWSSTSTRRRPTEIQKLAARRAVVRRSHALGSRSIASRACRASPPTPSTS